MMRGIGFTVHFSTLFLTTSTVFRNVGLRSRADIATLGFAISFATSASVALSCCSFVFLLRINVGLGIGVDKTLAPFRETVKT